MSHVKKAAVIVLCCLVGIVPPAAAAAYWFAGASAEGKEGGLAVGTGQLPPTQSVAPPQLVAQTDSATAPPAGTLPGGASSLQESFEDWQVHCAAQADAKRCTLSQEQANAQTHQRVLAIELGGGNSDKVDGILVLPFGLSLQSGATVQLDDTEVVASLKFRTCLPAGCILPFSFDTKTLAELRKGTALTINAVADGGAATNFKVSLKGFSGALDRTASLSK